MKRVILEVLWHWGKTTYPLQVYVFNAQGFHPGGLWVYDEQALRRLLEGPVLQASIDGREVRITDDADMMVWWLKDGEIQE